MKRTTPKKEYKKGCHVCISDRLQEIEAELLQGTSFAAISRRYAIDPYQISVHAREHWGRRLATRGDARLKLNDINVLGECEGKIKELNRLIADAEQEERPAFMLNAMKEHRAYLSLVAQIQAFVVTQQNAQKMTPQEVIADYNSSNNKHLASALRVLSPIEAKVYQALNLKMIAGQRNMDIEWINYSEELRPFEAEAVQVTVPGEKAAAREDMAPAKTDEEYFEDYEHP